MVRYEPLHHGLENIYSLKDVGYDLT